MSFVPWFFSPRSRDDWKSWKALIIAVPLAFGLVFVSLDAHRYRAIAERQQSTTGIVTAYEPANHNQCSYTFELRGKQYSGRWSSPTQTAYIGQTVQVYFDRSDPATNALEDFDVADRRQRGMQWLLSLGICAVIGFIAYAKSRSATTSTQARPPDLA